MANSWASNFSYEYFARLVDVLKEGYEYRLISEADKAISQGQPKPIVLLRHDIDVDIRYAPHIAEIEARKGIVATYFVMVNSPTYSVEDPTSRTIIEDLVSMGHEVGVHFDFESEQQRLCSPDLSSVESQIDAACKLLEEVTQVPVRSVSFHRPLPQFLRGPLKVADRINAYAAPLMEWYLSDSGGRWRSEEHTSELQSH